MYNAEKNLEILSNLLQIKSYEILIKDFNNTDLMKYLEHQDDLLHKIIGKCDDIISLLKGENNGYKKNNSKNN